MSVKDTNDVFKNLFMSEKKKTIVKTNIVPSQKKEEKNEENIDEENIDEENIIYTFQMKKKLATNIAKLEKFEQIQIYHIINNNNEKFTKNQNGILFDLLKFEDSTIKNLDIYVKMTTTYRKQRKEDNQSQI